MLLENSPVSGTGAGGGVRGRGPFAGAVAPALRGQSRVGLAEHGASPPFPPLALFLPVLTRFPQERRAGL